MFIHGIADADLTSLREYFVDLDAHSANFYWPHLADRLIDEQWRRVLLAAGREPVKIDADLPLLPSAHMASAVRELELLAIQLSGEQKSETDPARPRERRATILWLCEVITDLLVGMEMVERAAAGSAAN